MVLFLVTVIFLNHPNDLNRSGRQTRLAYVMCDLESDIMREKEEKNKISKEVEENRRQKYEEMQVR